jgi:hypothetical protein
MLNDTHTADSTPKNTLRERFAWMVEWARKMMGAEAHKRRLDGPIPVAAFKRIGRLGRRFIALYALWKAGTLPQARMRAPDGRERVSGWRPNELRRFNWFRRLWPDTAAPLAGALIELMQDEEMPALVAAAPQVGRILRPMCWMVGIRPLSFLELPKKDTSPRPTGSSPVAEPPSPQSGEGEVRGEAQSEGESSGGAMAPPPPQPTGSGPVASLTVKGEGDVPPPSTRPLSWIEADAPAMRERVARWAEGRVHPPRPLLPLGMSLALEFPGTPPVGGGAKKRG